VPHAFKLLRYGVLGRPDLRSSSLGRIGLHAEVPQARAEFHVKNLPSVTIGVLQAVRGSTTLKYLLPR
jgi:hypothetical protein